MTKIDLTATNDIKKIANRLLVTDRVPTAQAISSVLDLAAFMYKASSILAI
jgi:hypothetical protein